jgi:RHH-type proline utilization regulon transcriptional repressor/proline dehydrogenase/delta 1-pyrroline-5-carboxylate dehydrogenase
MVANETIPALFADFGAPVRAQSALRWEITDACRRPEPDCLAALIGEAQLPDGLRAQARGTAIALVTALRAKGQRGGVEALVKEYSLSSHEGVALMCLAEALLRIPDNATRDALIRDKIADGNWQAHLGEGRSLFVNAATWGLVVTGKLTGSVNETGLAAALARLVARAGEPVIRRGVDLAMQMMGEQFVTGQTIAEALKRARKLEAEGFLYSYDMLGEAATTAADAARYYADYETAIHAIGKASAGRGVVGGPGISIKLSALHPRYSRAQAGRVMAELLPRVRELALLAKLYDIGFNVDAEESDRLELSLDLLEELALDPRLSGWHGLGFVVQAYGKRCPFVIDWLADLARRSDRRIMVRLVKGAYWDSEIKRAQVDGLSDFPVYTRKVHTDVAYIAWAKRLLAAKAHLFPQFATHNAQTLATIYSLAGDEFTAGDYEFQCLHGMGEPLYEEVVGPTKLGRPCRIYAPVGTHETLLAYLVRRLLENGANSSFVHRIWDESVAVEEMAEDPVAAARAIAPIGAPHPAIALPRDLFAERCNSAGLDLASEAVLARLSKVLPQSAAQKWQAVPQITGLEIARRNQPVTNPADRRDAVGSVSFALTRDAIHAVREAHFAWQNWAAMAVEQRANCLTRAADLLEARMESLLGLIVREAGKSLANAVGEVREAVDFLRYYAAQARTTLDADHEPLGAVVCISPWNFPLAIFTGQIAAALVTGNAVLAKPAEETPLIAAEMVRLLHEAGVPREVLQFVPGDGRVGAALVAAPEVAGVMFTGSTEVAKLIQRELAGHMSPHGAPIPLVAETGGQNAMVVDSSALAEQVTADVIASAFDSAGQRCSALRVLCLQEDIADRQLAMLRGALEELSVGNPQRLACDIGPVISEEARAGIESYVARMAKMGCRVERLSLSAECAHGTFVAPTIIEIDDIAQLEREVFGPVLHIVRYRRDRLDHLITAIRATGYGLTFGIHTRIDETVELLSRQAGAGNVYVNRNVIGAVVGLQPFGGRGLSGTGPKAGGPLALGRLLRRPPAINLAGSAQGNPASAALAEWLNSRGETDLAQRAKEFPSQSPLGHVAELLGPVGERNLYALHPRGEVLLLPHSRDGFVAQLGAALATGNRVTVVGDRDLRGSFGNLPDSVSSRITWLEGLPERANFAAVLIEPGVRDAELLQRIAAMNGPIPLVQAAAPDGSYRLEWLVEEQSTSINTTAAGGNASLMALV